ncbi:MAG: cation acetate symporter, partial [Sphingomonadales bacterium]|nr:cation acetate symporter [Sphingomonadales bacterium]
GVVAGGLAGVLLALILTILSPAVWVAVLGNPAAIFPYGSPAIFSMPVAFVVIWIVSITDRSGRAAVDRAGFAAQQVRQETGIGAAGASAH